MKEGVVKNKKDRIILKSILAILLFMVINAVFGIIVGAITGIYNAVMGNFDLNYIISPSSIINQVNIASSISSFFSLMVIILIFRIPKGNLGRVINVNKIGFRDAMLSIGMGVGIYLVNIGISALTVKLFNLKINTDVNISEILITSIIATVIVAPIFEEILFRGIIFSRLKTKYKIISSVIIQGVIFGLSHLNLEKIFYAIVMGIILGFVIQKTKSIYTVIIPHIVLNFLALTGAFFKIQIQNTLLSVFLIIIGLVIVISLYKLLVKSDIQVNT